MGIEGQKRKGAEMAARAALQAAVLAATMLSGPGDTMAGKREATIKSFESKNSKAIRPGAVAEDVPKDDPKEPNVKFRIRE